MSERLRPGVLGTAVLGGWTMVWAAGTVSAAQLLDRATSPAHLRVRLVSEASAVAPTHRFWIGLDFALDPGWHVYWVNAGDSGQPPRATWTAPAGYEIGPLEWPQPTRILDSETIVDYGYTNHVLLIAPVGPSS